MKKIYTIFFIGILIAIPITNDFDEIDEPEELEEFIEHPVESLNSWHSD